MSAHVPVKRTTIRDIMTMKAEGRKIACLTAYSTPIARLMDPHVDLILVGDSLGMVVYGMDSTVPVTLDMMIAHGQAVMRGTEKALVVVDLPFGSYQESAEQAFRSAARVMKETGCVAVKLEGGQAMAETVSYLAARGIPVMGHVGLQPQSVNSAGGYRMRGRGESEARSILMDAKAIESAGAFAIVLECVDEALAARMVQEIEVPLIGIGASAACAGQILVVDDILGLSTSRPPKFVKAYDALHEKISSGIEKYVSEVRSGAFPADANVYAASPKKDGKTKCYAA